MALATDTLDFGAAPGSDYAFKDVAGFSGLTSANYAEAFEMYESSTNREPDETLVDQITLRCEILNATTVRVHGQVASGEIIGLVSIRVVTL
jgi:hypothetical protein